MVHYFQGAEGKDLDTYHSFFSYRGCKRRVLLEKGEEGVSIEGKAGQSRQ
jgi:hypothetical protein